MATTDYQQNYIEKVPSYRKQGPSSKGKFVVILLIFFVLAGVFLGVTTLLGSSDNQSSDSLVRAISRQKEITTIIDTHGKNVASSETANFVIRAETLLTSHTLEIERVAGKTATTGQTPVNSSTINETLTRAAQGTTFDDEIETVLEDLLVANASDLQNAFNQADSDELKNILDAIYLDQQSLIED